MPYETAYYISSDFTPEEDGVSNTGKSFRFVQKTFDRVTKETYEEELDRANAVSVSSSVDALLNDKDERTDS